MAKRALSLIFAKAGGTLNETRDSSERKQSEDCGLNKGTP